MRTISSHQERDESAVQTLLQGDALHELHAQVGAAVVLADVVHVADIRLGEPRRLEATHELKVNDVIRKALGRGRDEDYADYFIHVKREEWDRYHEQVTPWEVAEYLTRF